MTYSFRNGVRTAAYRRIFEHGPEFVLGESGQGGGSVVLLPASGSTSAGPSLQETTIFVIQGSGYPSQDDAFIAAREWRQYFTIGAARRGFPIEIGGLNEDKLEPHQFPVWDRTLVPDELISKFDLERSDRVLVDRIGLMIYEAEPVAKFFYPDWPDSIVACTAQSIKDAIQSIRTDDPANVWGEQLSLAYRLVHASLMANDSESKHILLVTAIEAVLPDRRKRSPDVVSVIDSLILTLTTLDGIAEIKTTVAALLRDDKYESISRSGAQLASQLGRTYGGKTAEQYFRHVYGIRSGLVHGSLRRLSADERDVIDEYKELLQFVLDMLQESAKSLPT